MRYSHKDKSDTAVKPPEQEQSLLREPLHTEAEGIKTLKMAVAAEMYQFVDQIPEVAEGRLLVRQASEALLEERRDGQRLGTQVFDAPVDALSTAYAVLNAETEAEKQERRAGLDLDCQRLVAEWFRKNTSEYFAPLRHEHDEETEDFFSHGFSIRQMTENALIPMVDNDEEEARRINERVEDATPQLVRKALGSVAVGHAIRTISECTDKAIGDYEQDQATGAAHRGYGGYVPEIKKFMIRDIRFQEGTNDRFEEQVGLRGTYIQHEIIQMALERCGAQADHLDKTELHGSQILAKDGILDFVAVLDEVASEQWCTNIFMGEEVAEDHDKDYERFRREAMERQAGLQEQSQTVANFILDLAADNVDRKEALTMVEDFVKKMLLNMAKDDNSIAEQMFDEQTAEGLREVVRLESSGRYDEAFLKMQEVEASAPGGGYCGAGSCGLESVNAHSAGGSEVMKALNAKAGDTIVGDKVRSCKCGSKTVYYAYSATKVNKYCTTCKRSESKKTTT